MLRILLAAAPSSGKRRSNLHGLKMQPVMEHHDERVGFVAAVVSGRMLEKFTCRGWPLGMLLRELLLSRGLSRPLLAGL